MPGGAQTDITGMLLSLYLRCYGFAHCLVTSYADANKGRFVQLLSEHLMTDSIAPQLAAFTRGLQRYISPDFLANWCSAADLSDMISGRDLIDGTLCHFLTTTLRCVAARPSDVPLAQLRNGGSSRATVSTMLNTRGPRRRKSAGSLPGWTTPVRSSAVRYFGLRLARQPCQPRASALSSRASPCAPHPRIPAPHPSLDLARPSCG
jgi:hypothetical protein|eukprot:COSAG01_NODE_2407_length_7753_cov_38.850536_3_plen_206_part_00